METKSFIKRNLNDDTDVDSRGILLSLVELYDNNIPQDIPSIDIQNAIARNVKRKDRSRYVLIYGIFGIKTCGICKRELHLYKYNSLNSFNCNTCCKYKSIDKNRIKIDVDKDARKRVKNAIYNIRHDGYDHDRNYKKYCTAIESRNSRLINLYSKDPGVKFKCNSCLQYGFIDFFYSKKARKTGLSINCNRCDSGRKNCLLDKISSLISRAKKNNIPIEESMSVVQMINIITKRQNDLDYYTMIPLVHVRTSPFSPSPEKIDRDGGYLVDNTALCFQILNVGGNKNWSRKLTMQIYFASNFDTVRYTSSSLATNRKLLSMYRNTISKSYVRGKKKDRKDKSGEHSLTIEQCVELIEKQDYRCSLSRLPLIFESNHEWMASIDRIDPTEGYHKWNCRIVIYRLNMGITWTVDTWTFFYTQLSLHIGKVIDVENFQQHVDYCENNNRYMLKDIEILKCQ